MGDHLRQPALWRWLLLPLAAVLALAGPAGAAQAHPMGPPQQASLSLAAPDQVRVTWKVGAPDDLSWLAYDLGLLPADRIMLDGAITPQADDVRLLQDSPALAKYLTSRVRVVSGGQECQPGRPELGDLGTAGASVVFTCAAPVHQASIELGLLTDLEASYATVATGADGTQAVYNGHVTSHDWTFDPATAPRPEPAMAGLTGNWLPAVGLGAALVLGIGGLTWWLAGRKRKQAVS
ncbi:hypothetical protein [Propionicimonas paludicola]|uniref:hypothetical protein n=1 Tax=Propionicimonas paludicola TaxID=185243 RepID=UPI000BF6D4DB|nr:hypothetical protein [Propionicimonas paludicola]